MGCLNLQLGFSHPIAYPVPDGYRDRLRAPDGDSRSRASTVSVWDRWLRRFAAMRPPEPYKGKGIRYVGERFERKEGKKK